MEHQSYKERESEKQTAERRKQNERQLCYRLYDLRDRQREKDGELVKYRENVWEREKQREGEREEEEQGDRQSRSNCP